MKFDRGNPSSMQIVINRLEDCLLDVSHWMAHNGLKLNNDKTEWLIFNGNPDFSKSVTLTVRAETIKQSSSIRNLGVRLEPDLTMLPHIEKIQLVQNAAARVITKTKRRDHVSTILRDLHWLPIKKRRDYKMRVLAFNALNDQEPSYIADFFTLYKPNRSLRSESNTSLVPVHGRSIQINKRLLNCGVSTTWNSLPKELRIIKSFILFKKHLKTYLFNL